MTATQWRASGSGLGCHSLHLQVGVLTNRRLWINFYEVKWSAFKTSNSHKSASWFMFWMLGWKSGVASAPTSTEVTVSNQRWMHTRIEFWGSLHQTAHIRAFGASLSGLLALMTNQQPRGGIMNKWHVTGTSFPESWHGPSQDIEESESECYPPVDTYGDWQFPSMIFL